MVYSEILSFCEFIICFNSSSFECLGREHIGVYPDIADDCINEYRYKAI